MNYIHYISSPLVNGSHYGNRGFASPMKELNDQTVLVETVKIGMTATDRKQNMMTG